MMTTDMYDAQASSIKVEDIATNENNRVILERMRRNNAEDCNNEVLCIVNQDEDNTEYCPEGAKDMGWLGYFVGRNDHLTELYIRPFDHLNDIGVMAPFFRGVSRNKSIRRLEFNGLDLLDGMIFTKMCQFFKNNNNFKVLEIQGCTLGEEGSRLLALAIGSCTNTSLTELTLMNNNLPDDGLVDIIISLSIHPNIQYLDLDGNQLQTNGCKALATLLKCSVTKLETLDLRNNELDDESIDALVPGLKSCSHLQTIIIRDNHSITSKGWQHLAAIFDTPNSNLDHLRLSSNIDDKAVASFASSLLNNSSLSRLDIDDCPSITEKGWESFSKLLCDATSVNSTFLSNHTLSYLGDGPANQNPRGSLLTLNERENKKEVAMIKILQTHDDFDMMPFFEWEFKVLPLMISWFERASSVTMPENFEPDIGQRKLSSIYQFVRAMPDLYVETYLMKELEDIKAARKQKEEELVILEDRQKSIMKRLGQQRGIPA